MEIASSGTGGAENGPGRRLRWFVASSALAAAALLAALVPPAAHSQRESRVANGPIYFSSDRGGERDIYSIRTGGRRLEREIERDGDQRGPAAVHPAAPLLFVERINGRRSDIYQTDTFLRPDREGGGVEEETRTNRVTSKRATNVDPAPFGFPFSFLYATDRDGDFELRLGFEPRFPLPSEFKRRIAEGLGFEGPGPKLTDNEADDREPSVQGLDGFRPRDFRIAFTSDRGASDDVWLVTVRRREENQLTQLTSSTAADSHPSVSPDGELVAFASDRDGDSEIYVIGSDGTGLRQLTDNRAFDGEPAFSPDGSKVAFSTDRDGDREIFTVSVADRLERRVTDDPGSDIEPSWAIREGAGPCQGRGPFERSEGTARADALIGTEARELIRAGGGRDVVRGRGGGDCLFGNAQGDLLYGNADGDILRGGGGFDRLHGNSGRDRIFGGQSADKLRGGDGPDALSGGLGEDLLFGGRDEDLIVDGRGADVIKGGSGNDFIFVGSGKDRVRCGRGKDDVVVPRGGATRVSGDCERVNRRRGRSIILLSDAVERYGFPVPGAPAR